MTDDGNQKPYVIRVRVFAQLAPQRFAFAAENIDGTPWGWVAEGPNFNQRGQASFKVTAYLKAHLASVWVRRRESMYARTGARVGR